MVGKSITIPLPSNDWQVVFQATSLQTVLCDLSRFLTQEIKHYTVLPNAKNWFKAFELTSFAQTKVVIIGQDPYPNPAHAQGLCFSVANNINPPASLKNIFKAIVDDLGYLPESNNLSGWATQGVLLLNSVLTVRSSQIGSHQNKGWEHLTDHIIHTISQHKQAVVFLLWGKYAQQKQALIDGNKHLILTSSHPSSLSAYRGFLTCKHFSKTNAYLTQHNLTTIDW